MGNKQIKSLQTFEDITKEYIVTIFIYHEPKTIKCTKIQFQKILKLLDSCGINEIIGFDMIEYDPDLDLICISYKDFIEPYLLGNIVKYKMQMLEYYSG